LEAAETGFESIPKPRRKQDEAVAESISKSIRRSAEAAWGKKPVCKVMIQRVV
jgi:ribonuclease J